MVEPPKLIRHAPKPIQEWWSWRQVRPWEMPDPDTQENGAGRCPMCGSDLVEVTTPVPVYPHDPEPEDDEEESNEPVLDLRRCGGCQRYQVGERREAA